MPVEGESRELVVCEEVTRTQIVQYAGASGDFSLLHTDEIAARAAGHRSLMAHGMMTMALTSRVATSWFGEDALRTFSVRFTAPVWPGDRLVSRAVITEVSRTGELTHCRLALETTNAEGETVLSGEATVALDAGSTERQGAR
jgi:acyl dehydratase